MKRITQAEIDEAARLRAAGGPVRGLGDIVAMFAKPVAGVIDSVAGTNLKNCGGCAKRQNKLNEKFPL